LIYLLFIAFNGFSNPEFCNDGDMESALIVGDGAGVERRLSRYLEIGS